MVALRQRRDYRAAVFSITWNWHTVCLATVAMLRTNSLRILLVSAACAVALAAQDYPAGAPYNDPPPPPNANAPYNQAQAQPVPPPAYGQQQGYPQQGYPQQSYPQQGYPQQAPPRYDAQPVPASLTLQPGSFVTVRVNQLLSSDKNQAGDTFYATLEQPVIIDGVVIARRGTTVMGRVSDAQKAGRVQGTSRLGLQLTSLTLVDGQQIPIQSQVISRQGDTSVGQDAGAIGVTTGMGAAIGAAAGGGQGAAIGAGAGAVASTLGVLLTRGRPTQIYPETMLTFRVDGPVQISTARSSAAFRYADQSDYGPAAGEPAPRVRMAPGPVAAAPYPYPAPYYYDPFYPYPYYGGGFSVFVGPRFGYGYGSFGGFRGGFRVRR